MSKKIHKKHKEFPKKVSPLEEALHVSQKKLKESEDLFQLLAEGAKDYAMLVIDVDGLIIKWNKGGEHVFGYTEKEILGKNFSLLFTLEDRNADRPCRELEKALKTGRAIDENWAVKKDGSTFWASGITSPLFDEHGDLRGLSKIVRDVTRQKEAEQSKNEFIGIVSHELKTPVTSVKAFIQVMQARFAKEGNQQSANLLSKMDAQVNRVTTIIGDLVDATKIEGGRLQFHEEFFAFDEVVSVTLEDVQRTALKHTIILNGKTGKTVFGDRNRIGQVITNLLTNSIKYSPSADKILVKTSSDKMQVKLCIQDFGIGIPKESQGKIFERFYRVEGKKTETFAGLGIGLYVASEIIKRQGGKIWVESEVGKGSTFCFSLPLKGSKGKRQQEDTFVEDEIRHE